MSYSFKYQCDGCGAEVKDSPMPPEWVTVKAGRHLCGTCINNALWYVNGLEQKLRANMERKQ